MTLEDKIVWGKWLLFPLLWLCSLNPQGNSAWDPLCPIYKTFFYSFLGFQRMHTTRSPSSIPTGVSGDALDLSLSGSQLSMSKRPSSASPGKYFSRSVSVSVATDTRGKRNTLVSNCALPHVCFCTGNRMELQIVYEFLGNLFKMQEWANQHCLLSCLFQNSLWYQVCNDCKQIL